MIIKLITLISMFVIAPLVYMAADNQPPYEFDATDSYVIPSQSQAGRQLTVHWVLKRLNRICPGSVTRVVVDQLSGARITYDPTPAASTIEVDDQALDRTFFLPPEVAPGMKWYFSDAEFACNPLQRFYPLRVRTPRLSFEVVP